MEEQKRQGRYIAIKEGAYSLTLKLYKTLSKGDVIIFSAHGGDEEHTAIFLCGQGIDKIEQQSQRIKELEQEIRLLKIVKAEALEACLGDDIEGATTILEQTLKG